MNTKLKTWAISGMLALSIILSPFIGKGVENTTKALLPGLSTEQQINTVADVVDVNKLEAETKLVELQSTIDAQQAKLAEQQQVIDSQNVKVESAKADVVATQAVVSNEAECRKLIASNSECKSDIYRSKSAFDKEMIETEKRIKLGTDEDIDAYKRTYATCQTIILKCN